jgi:acetyl-CoA C-acetyltransferase
MTIIQAERATNDGSTGMVLISVFKAKELGGNTGCPNQSDLQKGLTPFRLVPFSSPAVRFLMQSSRIVFGDFNLFEANEAFAGQHLICKKELGFDHQIANVNHSGIELGHLVDSTGARLIVTMIF